MDQYTRRIIGFEMIGSFSAAIRDILSARTVEISCLYFKVLGEDLLYAAQC
jgi:hypothetical protein